MLATLLAITLAVQQPKVYRDLVYVDNGGASQSLDLYLPQREGKVPVVVWVHGGGWRQGSKQGGPALALVREGFAVASINYRLSDVALFPAQIEDCKAAVRWIRANAGKYSLDKAKIGAWGGSAGGHLVALLGTSGGVKELEGAQLGNKGEDSRVQAVCDFYGPTDFAQMLPGNQAKNPKHAIALLLGGPLSEKQDLARKANPITYISREDPPFLICHGDKDALVPYSQSELLHKALQAGGVSSELVIVPGGSHGNLGPGTNQKAIAFFKKILG